MTTTEYSGVTVGGACEATAVLAEADPLALDVAPQAGASYRAVIVSKIQGYNDLIVFAETAKTDIEVRVRGWLIARFTIDVREWAIVRHLYTQPNEEIWVDSGKPQTSWTLNLSAMGATDLLVYTATGLLKQANVTITA